MDGQNISLTDLIALLQQINISAINDCYLHRNCDTGQIELNIELHNINKEDEATLKNKIVEYDSCAFWE